MEPPSRRSDVEEECASPPAEAVPWMHFSGDPIPSEEADAAALLGGKAASLGLLRRAGLPTPPAFTLTTAACRAYHAGGRQWPGGVWAEITAGIARLEAETARTFGAAPRPLTLAIRSGAAESMPGLLSTFLHCGLSEPLVRQIDEVWIWEAFAEFLDGYAPIRLHGAAASGDAHRPSLSAPAQTRCEQWLAQLALSPGGPLPGESQSLLRDAIAAVFDSWDASEARRYRDQCGWTAAEGTAVTIQAMFDSQVSGVAFSHGPRPQDHDDLLVEAIPGLGRRLVGGQVTPARWSVVRKTLVMDDARAADRRACDEAAAGRAAADDPLVDFAARGLEPLCRSVVRIESLFQQPVDVEFGYAGGELTFFQARPIPPPQRQSAFESVRRAERDRLLDWARQGRRLWVRHNLAENLPSPTPLSWDLWRAFMSGRGGYGRLYRRLGYRPSRRIGRDGFLELIAGQVYADPDRLPEMFCAGYPLSFDAAALRADPAALERGPTRLNVERLDPWFVLRWPLVVLTLVNSHRRRRRLTGDAALRFERDVAPRIGQAVELERRADLDAMSPEELVKVFHRRRNWVFDELAPETLLPGVLGAAVWARLEQRLGTILGEADGRPLAGRLLARIADPTTQRQRDLLVRLAGGETTMEAFLKEFGHRAPGEMDLSSPRWREMPEAVRAAARRLAATRTAPPESEAYPSPDDGLRTALEQAGAGCLYAETSGWLRQAAALLPCRESGKHELLRGYELLRDVVTEISNRFELGDDIHFLTIAEVSELPRDRDGQRRIDERRSVYRARRQMHVPAVLSVEGDMEDFGLPPPEPTSGGRLPAIPLSYGQASGRVFFSDRPERALQLPPGSVVVASTIDPGSMLLLADAAAFVVEQGGILSHAAILARQLAIPAVVVERITELVADGEAVRVDADRGYVELTERPS